MVIHRDLHILIRMAPILYCVSYLPKFKIVTMLVLRDWTTLKDLTRLVLITPSTLVMTTIKLPTIKSITILI